MAPAELVDREFGYSRSGGRAAFFSFFLRSISFIAFFNLLLPLPSLLIELLRLPCLGDGVAVLLSMELREFEKFFSTFEDVFDVPDDLVGLSLSLFRREEEEPEVFREELELFLSLLFVFLAFRSE